MNCVCGHSREQHSFYEDHDECDVCSDCGEFTGTSLTDELASARQRIERLEEALTQFLIASKSLRDADDDHIRAATAPEEEKTADALQDAWATIIIRENEAVAVLKGDAE